MHADCEVDWSESRGTQRGVYRGLTEVRRFSEEWLDLFDEIDIGPQRFIEAGGSVVVPNRLRVRGREGVTAETTSALVFTLSEGKIARLRMYQDEDRALEAVGLEE
jgi:ketosteroid isomerase-like protein